MKTASPELEMTMKTCKDCGEEKHVTEFSAHLETKDKLRGNCKSCRHEKSEATRDKDHRAEYNKDYYTSSGRKYQLMYKYGITPEQYEELLVKQKRRCGVCEQHESTFKTKLAVDHNHITGEIRGLLCTYCNRYRVGRHRDGDLLRKIADYVEQGTGWFVPKAHRATKRRKKKS